MNEFNYEFGAVPKGFAEASADEQMQVEGGFLGLGKLPSIVAKIIRTIKCATNPCGCTK